MWFKKKEKPLNDIQRRYLAAAEYAGYTDRDFWSSNLILDATVVIKIEQVIREHNQIHLVAERLKVKKNGEIYFKCAFSDKDNKTKLAPLALNNPVPMKKGEFLNVTYNLEFK